MGKAKSLRPPALITHAALIELHLFEIFHQMRPTKEVRRSIVTVSPPLTGHRTIHFRVRRSLPCHRKSCCSFIFA